MLLKKGDINNKENYRPISILPAMSEIFEIIMGTRIVGFLRSTRSTSEDQHGYILRVDLQALP